MKEQIKQTGLIIEFPKPTSYVAGLESPISAVRNPSGDWSNYLPDPENQFAPSFDTMSCTTFSATNCVEINLRLLPESTKQELRALGFDEKFNISKRFTAIMSGTTAQGNTFEKVADSLRNTGFIPEQDFPFGDAKTFAEYHDRSKITSAMIEKAKKVAALVDVMYDWVFFDQNPDFTDDQFDATSEALKVSPVQIGIQTPATHAISLIKEEKRAGKPWLKVFDHYPNYIFEGDTYKPHFGLRYFVQSKSIPNPAVDVYPSYTFTKYLTSGLRNDNEVKMMQKVLIIEGCLKAGLDTGNFANLTLQAVKTFQAKYGIDTTGTVGPKTRAKLNELCSKKKSNFSLKPKVQRLCDQFVSACKDSGIIVQVTEGFRSMERQAELYNQPFDKKDNDGDGKIDEADEKVTNAKAGQSFHNYGVAFDVIFVINGRRTYEGDWNAIGRIGRSIGLDWGGDWKTFVDRPHFQFTGGYTLDDFINNRVDWNRFN